MLSQNLEACLPQTLTPQENLEGTGGELVWCHSFTTLLQRSQCAPQRRSNI